MLVGIYHFGFHYLVGNISEPIYENVPLPWPHPVDNGVAENSRSRASSIQSAPEMNNVTITNDRNNVTNVTITEEVKPSASSTSEQSKSTFSNPSSTASSSSRVTSGNHSVNTSIGKF